MARLVSPTRLIAVAALAAVMWIACRARPPAAEGADRDAIARIFDGRNAGGKRVNGFWLNGVDGAGGSANQVCADTDGFLPYFWGSYIGGDRFTGTLRSPWVPITAPVWYVPVLGYPASSGESLVLELRSADGTRTGALRFDGPNPGETVGFWEIPLGAWLGGQARVVCVDRLVGPQGWLGVGAPIASQVAGLPARRFTSVRTDYLGFALAAAAIALLLVLPGLALGVRAPYLPIPGVVLMAGLGLALWAAKAGSSLPARDAILLAYGGLALVAAWRGAPVTAWTPLAAAGLLTAGSLAYSVLPWPVAQEWAHGTSFQGRMVASPPDHLIPYSTACFFHAGFRLGKQEHAYFGDNSVVTRGPLVPFCINTVFTLFRIDPKQPPDSTADAWPAAADGFYLARIIGVLTNACVVLGAVALATAWLDPEDPKVRFAAWWMAAAPVAWVNTAFVWPKLFAAYFVLLALAEIVSGGSALMAGALGALAYLSHPVGGLFCVPLVIYLLTTSPDAGSRCFRFAIGLAAVLAPWVAFKAGAHHPDAFWSYPLGDGHGLDAAASVRSWFYARALNAWYTLVPGAFLAGHAMTTWIWGPLSGPSQWAAHSAKTLPGNLAWAGWLLACLACAQWPRLALAQRQFLTRFAAPALAVLLLYWGYSEDGLGRNCLEPLSCAVIAWTAAARPYGRGWLVLIAGESAVTLVCGFVGR